MAVVSQKHFPYLNGLKVLFIPELALKHSGVKKIQVYGLDGPCMFSGGDNHEMIKVEWIGDCKSNEELLTQKSLNFVKVASYSIVSNLFNPVRSAWDYNGCSKFILG